MKGLGLIPGILVFFLIFSERSHGQTIASGLDQLELMKQFVGTWQVTLQTDTVMEMEMQQFGATFSENDYLITNKTKSFDSKWSYGYSPKEGKFKFFALYPNGNYQTWIGMFTSGNTWYQEMVEDFNPEKVITKLIFVFDSPASFTASFIDRDGVKKGNYKWSKVK